MDNGRTLGPWPSAQVKGTPEPQRIPRNTPTTTITSSNNKILIPHQYISMEFQADELLRFVKLTQGN